MESCFLPVCTSSLSAATSTRPLPPSDCLKICVRSRVSCQELNQGKYARTHLLCLRRRNCLAKIRPVSNDEFLNVGVVQLHAPRVVRADLPCTAAPPCTGENGWIPTAENKSPKSPSLPIMHVICTGDAVPRNNAWAWNSLAKGRTRSVHKILSPIPR